MAAIAVATTFWESLCSQFHYVPLHYTPPPKELASALHRVMEAEYRVNGRGHYQRQSREMGSIDLLLLSACVLPPGG